MPARELTTLFEGGAFFEGPRWREGRWWVSDFYGHGGEDGCTLLLCAAPDFLEANRAHTREAVLLTTVVDVPHAGLP